MERAWPGFLGRLNVKKSIFRNQLLRKVVTFLLIFSMVFSVLIEMCPVPVLADESSDLMTNDANGIEYNEWLHYMPDDIPISRINMLATHDSGCYNPDSKIEVISALLGPVISAVVKHFTSKMAQAQDKTITEQLERGVRVLDIRGGFYGKKVTSERDPYDLIVCHKLPMVKKKGKISSIVSFDYLRFNDVFNEIEAFLKDHPSETVVLSLNTDGIPLEPFESTSDKLVEKLVSNLSMDPRSDARFIYFPVRDGNTQVPNLGTVRGKCVVLWDLQRPMTSYENHYSVGSKDKSKYLKHFFERHNSNEEYSKKYSNKMAQYKKDHFKKEDYENDPDNLSKEGDPEVKLINYSSNQMVTEMPIDIAKVINPIYEKRSLFHSEVRYGWIGKDFVGSHDPIDGIIYSNVGSTYFKGEISWRESKAPTFLKLGENLIFEGVYGDGKIYPIDLSLGKYKYGTSQSNDGYSIWVEKLPCYAPDGSRIRYRLRVIYDDTLKMYETRNDKDGYMVVGESWTASQQYVDYILSRNSTYSPLEVQWIPEPSIDFKVPETPDEIFKILKLYYDRYSPYPSDKVKEIEIEHNDPDPYFPHLTSVDKKKDETGTYYYTRVGGLASYDMEISKPYTYKVKMPKFKDETYQYVCKIVTMPSGINRLIINVYDKNAFVNVPGKMIFNDGKDYFGIRNEAIKESFPIRIYKYVGESLDDSYYLYSPRMIKREDEADFVIKTAKYNSKHEAFDRFKYDFKDELTRGSLDNASYMGRKNRKDDEITYDLMAKSDLTVVFNMGDSGLLPQAYVDSITAKIDGPEGSQYSQYEFTAENKGEKSTGIYVFESGCIYLPIFKNTGSLEMSGFNEDSIEAIKDTLEDTFKVTYGAINDVNTDSKTLYRHYVIYCDYIEGRDVVSGTVCWNDGPLDKQHLDDETKGCIIVKKIKINGESEEAPVDITDRLYWSNNHFYYSAPTDSTVKYEVTANDIYGYSYEKDAPDGSVPRYVFTKKISVNVKDIPEDAELKGSVSIQLLRNDGSDLSGVTGVYTDDSTYTFKDLPIAGINNKPYEYSVNIENTGNYTVDYISRGVDQESGDVTINVAFYKEATGVVIPVELKLEGAQIDTEGRFIIKGLTDNGLLEMGPLSLNSDNNYEGKFEIPVSGFKKADAPYYLEVTQVPSGDANISRYDEHESVIQISVNYLNGNKSVTAEWGYWEEKEDGEYKEYEWKKLEGVESSIFTNSATTIPARLDIEGLSHKAVNKSDDVLEKTRFTYLIYTKPEAEDDNEDENDEVVLAFADVKDNCDGSPKTIKPNDGQDLYFYVVGDYTLYVSAVDMGIKGWLYDDAPYKIKFSVVKSGDGRQLQIENPSYEKDVISQIYSSAKYQIPVRVKTVGIESTSDQFTIEAQCANDTEALPYSIKVPANEISNFEAMSFYEPGEYDIHIRETALDGNIDWLYDDSIVNYRIKVTRSDDGRLVAESEEEIPTFINRYTHKPISVNVMWFDAKDSSGRKPYRPNELIFSLSADGAAVGGSRSVSGSKDVSDWSYSTEQLPYYKLKDGPIKAIDYSVLVDSQDIEEHYTVDVFGDAEGGFNIFCIEKSFYESIDVSVRAEWDDDNNSRGKRPQSVQVSVNQEPSICTIDSQSMSEGNGYKAFFEELPKYILGDEDEKIETTYSITPEIVEGYDISVFMDNSTGEYVIRYELIKDHPDDPKEVSHNSNSSGAEGCTLFKLHFMTNGGTLIPDYYGYEGEVVYLKKFITLKTGEVFTGWYEDKALTKKVDVITLLRDTEVYAGWGTIKIKLDDIDGNKPINIVSSDVTASDYYIDDNTQDSKLEEIERVRQSYFIGGASAPQDKIVVLPDRSKVSQQNRTLVIILIGLIVSLLALAGVLIQKLYSYKRRL